MVKALVLLSTFLLLCAAHERPEVSKQQEAIARLSAEVEAHAGAKEYAAAAGKQEELEAATAALGEVTRLEGELATLAEAKKYAAAAAKKEELEAVVAALASGTTCGAGTMEAAVEAARKLADDGERKAILGALENIKAGDTTLYASMEKKKIGDAGAVALAKVLPASQLTSLYLGHNKIGDAGAAALAKALPASQLTSLGLWGNNIGDAGAAALAKALPASQLTSLGLEKNKIGDAGAVALAKALPASQLTSLGLLANKIGDAGAAALAKALPASQLTLLNHFDNNIGGKCGTGWHWPSGTKGALCDAWRAKHGAKVLFHLNGGLMDVSNPAVH